MDNNNNKKDIFRQTETQGIYFHLNLSDIFKLYISERKQMIPEGRLKIWEGMVGKM